MNSNSNIHQPKFRWFSLKEKGTDAPLVGLRTSIDDVRADIVCDDGKYHPFIVYPAEYDINGHYVSPRANFDTFFEALTWAEQQLYKYLESVEEDDELEDPERG